MAHWDPFGYLDAAVMIPREEKDWDHRDMVLACNALKRLVKYLVEQRGIGRAQAVEFATELFVDRRLFQRSVTPHVGGEVLRDEVVADLGDLFDAVADDEGQDSNEVEEQTVSTDSESSSDDGDEEVPPPAPKRRCVVVDLTGDDSV